MALNKEQAQQKVKEILDLARNEKKTLTYQDVMNKLSDLDIDADAIDAVFETLESEGINVINATEDETAVLPADVTGTDMDISVPEGVSIGALSFVPSNYKFEPWTVYAGRPIRPIKKRNKENVLNTLRKIGYVK